MVTPIITLYRTFKNRVYKNRLLLEDNNGNQKRKAKHKQDKIVVELR